MIFMTSVLFFMFALANVLAFLDIDQNMHDSPSMSYRGSWKALYCKYSMPLANKNLAGPFLIHLEIYIFV